ncbi:MAG: DUF4870 domain-containing protein [Chloroflexi bacterium]|nr:MAG: DUF4870 domain-containing protein [Chloroflexota bacterium]
MSEQVTTSQDERTLAALAHGSILLGLFSNGIGGIVTALVIWAVHRNKSTYVAYHALQALVYQVATFLLTMLAWCCWGLLWTLMILGPMVGNPGAYDTTPPAGLWVGMAFMVVPLGIWALTILYALWGAVRCLGGHEFKVAVIGDWVEAQ